MALTSGTTMRDQAVLSFIAESKENVAPLFHLKGNVQLNCREDALLSIQGTNILKTFMLSRSIRRRMNFKARKLNLVTEPELDIRELNRALRSPFLCHLGLLFLNRKILKPLRNLSS